MKKRGVEKGHLFPEPKNKGAEKITEKTKKQTAEVLVEAEKLKKELTTFFGKFFDIVAKTGQIPSIEEVENKLEEPINLLKHPKFEKYFKYIYNELKGVFFYGDGKKEYKFSEEQIKKIAEVSSKLIGVYTNLRKVQQAYGIPLPSFIHAFRVVRNIKLLLLEGSEYFGIKYTRDNIYFFTIVGLLHDFIEDDIKARGSLQTTEGVLQLYSIDKIFENDKKINLQNLVNTLDNLNLPGGLKFDEKLYTFNDKEELKKLKKYVSKISSCKKCLLVKLADLLDNTWGPISDKQRLKYSYYLFEIGIRDNKNQLKRLLNRVVKQKEENKSFPEIDYETFRQLLEKLGEAVDVYKRIYQSPQFEKYTGKIDEEKFKDDLIHYIAFVDKENFENILEIIVERISELIEFLNQLYGISIPLVDTKKFNFNYFREFINRVNKKGSKYAKSEIFKYIFPLIIIYGIKYIIFLKRINDFISVLESDKKNSGFEKISVDLKLGNSTRSDIPLENKENIEKFIKYVLYKLSVPGKGIRHIKARVKTGKSVGIKLIREPKRIEEINEYRVLKDQLGIAVVFNREEDAKNFAKSIKKLPRLKNITKLSKHKIVLLEEPADRGLIGISEKDKEDTTIFLPFTNFKFGVVLPNEEILPLEVSVRPSSIGLIIEKLQNFTVNKIRDKNLKKQIAKFIKKDYENISSIILNIYEPTEHAIYRGIQNVFMLFKIKEKFYTNKNSLDLSKKKVIDTVLNNILEEVDEEVKKILEEKIAYLEYQLATDKECPLDLSFLMEDDLRKKVIKKLFSARLLEKICKKEKGLNKKAVENIKRWIEGQDKKIEVDCSKYNKK